MADQKNKLTDRESERSPDAECLVLEVAGQTWHVPFNSLPGIPRVGETIRLAGGSAGKVAEVEYEFAPEGPPVELAREMPGEALYAHPIRVVVRLS